jgi:hypothetical protein
MLGDRRVRVKLVCGALTVKWLQVDFSRMRWWAIADPLFGASRGSVTLDDVEAVIRRLVGAPAELRVAAPNSGRDQSQRQQGWDRGPGSAADGHPQLPSDPTPAPPGTSPRQTAATPTRFRRRVDTVGRQTESGAIATYGR